MKIEQQVISLELAKRLKELGVKQESLCFWCDGALHMQDSMYHSNSEKYAAFTVAELGEMLPQGIVSGRTLSMKSCVIAPHWQKHYEEEPYKLNTGDVWAITKNENEAEVRGLMLAYLLENKLIAL